MEVAPPDAGAAGDLIYVPVPRSRLIDVYRLLASDTSDLTSTTSRSAEDVGNGRPSNLVERAYRESPERMKKFLGVLVDEAPRWVSSSELAQRVGIRRAQLAGVLGAFGRRWANRYQQREVHWFFRTQWNQETHMWHYSLPEAEAEVIRTAMREEASYAAVPQ